MKKILVLLLCFNIVLAPTYAFANTLLGGWTITQQIAQGASTILTGSKEVILNGAKKIATGTAKITPTASQVSKVLARGAAGYALSVAVEQLLGTVDWVLDSANNQIKYKPKSDPQTCSGYQHLDTMQIFCSAQALVDYQKAKHNWYSAVLTSVNVREKYADIYFCFKEKQSSSSCLISDITTIVITGTDDTQEQTIPLPVVAQKVISNAESGDSSAQAATTAAAADIIAEAETDNVKARPIVQQLENTQSIPTDQTAKGDAVPKDTTGTGNPPTTSAPPQDLTLDFPIFCDWAPSVCQAAKEIIALPITLTDWWNTATQSISASWLTFKEWLDWTKNDSELPDNQTNEVTELPIPELQENAISWSASCPPDVQVPVNLYGQSSTLTFSWSPWCQLLNIIKPAIIASAYIGAAFIVLGLRT